MSKIPTILLLSFCWTVQASDLPRRLSETGLFLEDSGAIQPAILPFAPQYPLWSDGAQKRRWIHLPPGTAIDASNPDEWEFPRGTRLWKEFGYSRPVETRFIERLADGSWRYATYAWNEQGSEALLVPSIGLKNQPVSIAPNGRYSFPSREDCLACHEGTAVPVLGFSSLQLSPERDSNAAHAEAAGPELLDLTRLVQLGLVRNLPPDYLQHPPRIASDSPVSRAALGYLHANCGHCHNATGPLAMLELELLQGSRGGAEKTLLSLINQASEFREPGLELRLVPGRADASVLAMRMQSRDPLVQMPPLGSSLPDPAGIALISRWIDQQTLIQKERSP